ncbi:MAG: hypothetical protein CMG25_05265 [Candidatus Marinimicrobia bacterium]|nr:hypothetical protein [Candidatus Neomarinimicrobiota bacterium]|tara:strand:- start:4316 stop:5077 length:762 start_codon:yes stop_codon:yes gene_type:complete
MNSKLTVKTAYANIYSNPQFSSQLVTQALFFETLEVISHHGNWFKVSQWDNYIGYIHKFYLFDDIADKEKKYIIKDRFLFLYDSVDFKNIAMVAPFGCEIPAILVDNNYYTIQSDNKYFFKEGSYIFKNDKRSEIIECSKKLIGSPYLWGGKTPFGYDCSGFVQQVFKSINISLKRDTSEQIKDKRMNSIDITSVNIGDIVFFDMEGNGVDHVGIWYGENQIIHCGGEVKIQSIKEFENHIIDIKSIGNLINE